MNRNNQNNRFFGNNYNQNQGNYYNGNNNQYNNYGNNRQYNNRQYNNQYNNQYYNQNNRNNPNGQFNPNMQYQYNPYNNPDKRNKKKKLDKELLKKIGIGVGAVVLLISLFLLTRSCSKSKDEEVKDEEIQRIGSGEYGYISIPNDWLKLEGTTASSGLRYADKDITYVATLDTSSTLNSQDFVYTARNQLQAAGVSDFVITEVDFCNYKAYKLTGYHQGQNKYVVAYFFSAEDNITHYVGVEGPDNQSEYFKIPDTFKLTE